MIMEKFKDLKNNLDEKALLYIAVGFLIGLITGFILSPAKNGMKNTIAIGSYNGSDNEFRNSNNVENGKKGKNDKE